MPSVTKPVRKMQTLIDRTRAYLTPSASSSSLPKTSLASKFTKAPSPTTLFPPVDPAIDGEDCLHDCMTCTISYPRKFEIEENDRLYGQIKGWNTHLIVATGKSDWVRDVADEKGSVMEAVGRHGTDLDNGRCMLSASNMPTPDGEEHGGTHRKTRVLLMPAWKMVEDVDVSDVGELLDNVVAREPTNVTPLSGSEEGVVSGIQTPDVAHRMQEDDTLVMNGHAALNKQEIPPVIPSKFVIHACPHHAVVLMCSQKTRDARCGQSAPLLRKEFERHLRPLGLYRDLHDERPGGVGIYFISHVGGHKYSANIMIYRRQGRNAAPVGEHGIGEVLSSQAVQGIWLARVRPDEVENIVRYTILQGKVVKPERQLRGGFDREKGLVSW